MTTVALLSTSDTDLLSARAATEAGADYVVGNPSRLTDEQIAERVADADIVVVRYLGSPQGLWEGFSDLRTASAPLVVLGGTQEPDAALMELSTVPPGTASEAHRYLAEGGADNLTQLHAFLGDTLLLTGEGFEAPQELPQWGVLERDEPPALDAIPRRPRVGVLIYKAQFAAGNTAYAHALADAIDAAGGQGVIIHSASLRDAPDGLLEHLGTLDALVTTVLAAGGTKPATAGAGEDDEAWDVEKLAALDIPILQGLCLTWGRADWEESDDGMSPLDVATQVAVPEFDGRLITVAFSFKEFDDEGLPHYVADPERAARVAGIARRRSRSAGSRSSSRPTRRSTPASATPSASTPRSRRSACSARCARRGTTSAKASSGWTRCRRSRGRPPTRPAAMRSSTSSSPPVDRTRSGSPRSRSRARRCASPPTATSSGSTGSPPTSGRR